MFHRIWFLMLAVLWGSLGSKNPGNTGQKCICHDHILLTICDGILASMARAIVGEFMCYHGLKWVQVPNPPRWLFQSIIPTWAMPKDTGCNDGKGTGKQGDRQNCNHNKINTRRIYGQVAVRHDDDSMEVTFEVVPTHMGTKIGVGTGFGATESRDQGQGWEYWNACKANSVARSFSGPPREKPVRSTCEVKKGAWKGSQHRGWVGNEVRARENACLMQTRDHTWKGWKGHWCSVCPAHTFWAALAEA